MNLELPKPSYGALIAQHFHWASWERAIETHGYTVERPRRSAHPDFPEIIYPIDYGYIEDTLGPDGHEVDLFIGTADTGLVALVLTVDHRRDDREFKLLYGCLPEEIYLVNGFLNFDPALMQGLLVMRRPMHDLWGAEGRG